MPSASTITLDAGKSATVRMQVTDEKYGVPQVLAEGVSIAFTVSYNGRIAPKGVLRFVQLTSDTYEILVTDRVNGMVKVDIPTRITKYALTYNYLLELIGAGGSPRVTVAQGLLVVTAS